MITLYNSKSREIEKFSPLYRYTSMYVCGPTVYGPAHIGNARTAVVFDQLNRLLNEHYGQDTTIYVRNFTDIDDKIINASIERNVPITRITDTAIASYNHDMNSLNCEEPFKTPRATEYVDSMILMINNLIQKDHAYEVDGEVFFHVPSNPHASLANHSETVAGSRVEVDPRKKDPRDFVMWKPSKPNEPSWESPWGNGRPGWHIECSAMIWSMFGDETIDIHGGGQDLRFPHHEAECAQSQCHSSSRNELARFWVHNGMLTVDGKKMSKSLGNVIYLNELMEKYPGESVRLHYLHTHYRSPMNFTMQGLDQAHRVLDKFYSILHKWENVEELKIGFMNREFLDVLSSDLNTPGAIAVLHRLADTLNETGSSRAKSEFLAAGRLLGLFSHTTNDWRTLGVDKELVERLISERQEAKAQKDYGKADTIRQQLLDMGITLADGVHGTEWRKV